MGLQGRHRRTMAHSKLMRLGLVVLYLLGLVAMAVIIGGDLMGSGLEDELVDLSQICFDFLFR